MRILCVTILLFGANFSKSSAGNESNQEENFCEKMWFILSLVWFVYYSVALPLDELRSYLQSSYVLEITPLHEAAELGLFKIAKNLIENGADVNAKNSIGETPLHLAAKNSEYSKFWL